MIVKNPLLILLCLSLVTLNVGAESVADIPLEISINTAESVSELEPEQGMSVQNAWKQLVSKDYQAKELALDVIAKERPSEAIKALNGMLNGELYYASQSDELYLSETNDAGYRFMPLFGGQEIVQKKKRGFKKVRINNQMRGKIRQILATLQLEHSDYAVRLAAVNALLKAPDITSEQLISEVIQNEENAEVREAMEIFLAIRALSTTDVTKHEDSINTLSGSLHPSALNVLRDYQARTPELDKHAKRAITEIEYKKSFFAKVETVFFGLSLGSVLALAAIGLAITFGVMGVINMAHGELMMLGAYTTYVVQLLMPNHIGMSIIVAIPAAFLVSGAVGIAIERGVIRYLYGRPLETLLATFGISLILQQAVRSIFSPLNRAVETPQWISGAWQINEVLALTWNRFYIILFCLAVFLVLITIMKKTPLGLQVRAVAQNRTMARAMGVRSDWVDALTFGLGSGIAGIAGVGLSLLTNVGPNLGQAYIIDSFMVVVFGGVGNLSGTLVAGLGLGVANKLLEPWAGAVLAKIMVLVFIILFIQKRPMGLFPQRGRAAED